MKILYLLNFVVELKVKRFRSIHTTPTSNSSTSAARTYIEVERYEVSLMRAEASQQIRLTAKLR